MRFSLRRVPVLLGSSALLFWCSCDEHKVGELPEVQREHVELVKAQPAVPESSPEPSAKMGSTPAQFFSPAEKKSP